MNTRKLAFCGILAAAYAAVTVATSSFAYGPIQFRVAEALCVLCFFTPSAVWGLTLGCFFANLASPLALDMIIGTAATLIGCLIASKCRKPWLVPVPVILANAVLVGIELSWLFTPDLFWQGLLINCLQVAIGEIAVLYLLGMPLLFALQKGRAGEWLQNLVRRPM